MTESMKLVIFGQSGHAKVVIDAVERAGIYRILGLIGAEGDSVASWFGHPVVGTEAGLDELCRRHGPLAGVVAIGDNRLRRKVAERAAACHGLRFVPIVHPRAIVAPSASIGAGAFVAAGATICADARIGDHAIVNTNASVDHDCVLEPFSFVGPNAALGGDVTVGAAALVGIGAAVRQGIRIGAGAVVGAGAAVVADIPPDSRALGVPARVV